VEVVDGTDAAHEDSNTLVRDSCNGGARGILIDAEGAQVPRVDANDRRPDREGTIDLFEVGSLHDGLHAEGANAADEGAKIGILKSANEQQDERRAHVVCQVDLDRIENELLVKHGNVHCLGDSPDEQWRAPESRAIRQDADH